MVEIFMHKKEFIIIQKSKRHQIYILGYFSITWITNNVSSKYKILYFNVALAISIKEFDTVDIFWKMQKKSKFSNFVVIFRIGLYRSTTIMNIESWRNWSYIDVKMRFNDREKRHKVLTCVRQ